MIHHTLTMTIAQSTAVAAGTVPTGQFAYTNYERRESVRLLTYSDNIPVPAMCIVAVAAVQTLQHHPRIMSEELVLSSLDHT